MSEYIVLFIIIIQINLNANKNKTHNKKNFNRYIGIPYT